MPHEVRRGENIVRELDPMLDFCRYNVDISNVAPIDCAAYSMVFHGSMGDGAEIDRYQPRSMFYRLRSILYRPRSIEYRPRSIVYRPRSIECRPKAIVHRLDRLYVDIGSSSPHYLFDLAPKVCLRRVLRTLHDRRR